MHSVPWPSPSSAFEVSSDNVLYIFLDVMDRISPEWMKCTLISLMRWRFTTIVMEMAHSLMYSVSIV